MTQKPSSGKNTASTREDRLKAALKANLARRKAQVRARSDGGKADKGKTSSEGS